PRGRPGCRARAHYHHRRRQTNRRQWQTLRAWALYCARAKAERNSGDRIMTTNDVVIVGMARTPMGGLLGELSGITATRLGSIAVRAAMTEAGLDNADQIIMGNVLSAGLGQAPARQAALGAGLDKSTQAVTLNKMCGSGLQAVAMARQALL